MKECKHKNKTYFVKETEPSIASSKRFLWFRIFKIKYEKIGYISTYCSDCGHKLKTIKIK